MHTYLTVLLSFILLRSIVKSQYYLYHTDFIDEFDLYYHCLYYKVVDIVILDYQETDPIDNHHQLIPYCIRSLINETEVVYGNISSLLTFEQLKQQNFTAEDLLSWSAPMDLVEQYENYLNTSNIALTNQSFYNCSPLWFGPACQYTFFSNESFEEHFHRTLKRRFDTAGNHLLYTNLTCYMELNCYRGAPPLCLDWREICDGRIDCFDDGIDEKHCMELEMNECEKDEYRCQNGLCASEQFLRDDTNNPDCLDSTDEDLRTFDTPPHHYFLDYCIIDPAFRCEESRHSYLIRNFVCGDGEEKYFLINPNFSPPDIILDESSCSNRRPDILFNSMLLHMESADFTTDCSLLLICATMWIGEICWPFFNNQDILIQRKCNYTSHIILPVLPILQNDIQFGFWINRTIKKFSLNENRLPDFICYNVQRCSLFPFSFHIKNLTCFDIKQSNIITFDEIIRLFHTCLSVDISGNETHCRHSSLFHCPGTSKCISKHRLMDGIDDCYGGADEVSNNSCSLNQIHRFSCSSEYKCISPVLVQDHINHCKNGEDEASSKKKLSFQTFCNGYINILPDPMDDQNETDETNCEQWPCINPYTRCDGAWTCANGADELNCNPFSKCYPDQHECVSPTSLQVICLPLNQTADGKVDCIAATDEREYCRQTRYSQLTHSTPYRCWNSTYCVSEGCFGALACDTERDISTFRACRNNPDIDRVLLSLQGDEILKGLMALETMHVSDWKYFSLHFSNHLAIDPQSAHWKMTYETHISAFSEPDVSFEPMSLRQLWICNRGLLVYSGIAMLERCLCPPSYYSDRCQFQSQRVSLTLKFSKECASSCQGIYAIVMTLLDDDRTIHSYEQLTYIPTINCSMKYNFYFLYQSHQKDLTKNYIIHLDVYNKINLTYHSSWMLPIKFPFLPVSRLAVHLIIPAYPVDVLNNYRLVCGDHGRCIQYSNNDKHFCRCDSDWSGPNCTIHKKKCDCSSDSLCLGIINQRSICLCPLNKIGPRCFLHSICYRKNPCQNGGSCVPEDDRISMNNFICVCPKNSSGRTCEISQSRIDITFNKIKIPQLLLIHLITVQLNDHPLITTTWKKIILDEDTATFYTLTPFDLIIVQILDEYYLSFLSTTNTTQRSSVELEIKSSDYCSPISRLLDQQTVAFPLLRRVKSYHIPCQQRLQMKCFHDNETFMCLCHNDRHANCFPFDFQKKSFCSESTKCEHHGQCVQDISLCPTLAMCICQECSYGGRCQFTTEGFSLSLDVILAYQVRQHTSIHDQRSVIKISIIILILLLFIASINSTLSAMTFQSEKLREVGCGISLYILSILSLLSMLSLNLKFWLFILSQMSLITNRSILKLYCISMEFILQSLLAIGNWLSAYVAIERTLVVKQGVRFNKKKSKQTAKWIIMFMIILTMVSLIYDPINRQLIDDEDERRTWCVVRYSSLMRIVDSIVNFLHFIVPFLINLFSAIFIIINAARTHSNARKQQTYKQHLKEQFHHQKHLIISPIIIVILSTPRLIISFLYGCMKSNRNPWLFLFGYYISFVPSLLTLVVFILPSEVYKKEFYAMIQRQKRIFQNYLHCH